MYRRNETFSLPIYDAVSDVDRYFPEEFRKYVGEQNLMCERWDRNDYPFSKKWLWFFRKEQQLDSMDSAYTDIMDKILSIFNFGTWSGEFLVQIWKAEVVYSGNHFDQRHYIFTTKNQPFLLVGQLDRGERFKKICTYRMRIVDINNGNEGAGKGGVIDRVFRNKRMEFTPEVGCYTYEEYPCRDLAISFNIKGSLALPLSDTTGRPLGVLEFVSTHMPSALLLKSSLIERTPLRMLQEECLDYCRGLCGHYHTQGNYENCVAEIKEVMTFIGKSCNLVHGQTWMLCKLCNSISTCEKFGNNLNASFTDGSRFYSMLAQCSFILKAEEGVVGKAASSHHHIVYCKDVTKFRISDYPLAHFMRYDNFFACCAVSLRSIYTEDQVYVIEFVLDRNRDLRAELVSIFKVMRHKFQTFKLASGEEFGNIDNLSVQVIDASSPDKIVTLGTRGLALSSSIGENNVEVVRPYLQQSNMETAAGGTCDPMIGIETSSQDSQTSTGQSFQLTVKASYGGHFIKFKLSASSKIHELNQHVFQRLQLHVGTYVLSYQDDDGDLILITCNDDLREYVKSSAASGKRTSEMWIEPKPVL